MPEYSNYIESRDPIADADVDGTELHGVSKDGESASMTTAQIAGFSPYTLPFPQVTASGTDTYTATLSPAITAYATGQKFQILFTNANTGAATLNFNALGAKSIVKNGATALSAGDISAGQILMLGYDGTNLQIIGVVGGTGGGASDWGDLGGTLSDQTDLQAALDLKAPLDSPTFTTAANAPTPSAGDDDTSIATTAFHKAANRAESAETADRALAQTDDQKVLFANKATTLTFDCPSLAENTWIIIVQVNAGAVAFTTSGGVTFENSVTPGITGDAKGSGIALWYRTTTSVLAMVGDITNLLTSLSVNGTLAVKAGSSSGILAKVGGVIKTDTTTVGNVTTGEDTLYTYTVPAATLSVNKDSLRGFVAGTFAANGNNKAVRVKYGATTIFDTGSVAFNAGDWRVDFFIIRTGATTQKCIATFTSSNTTLDETCDYTTAAETLSGAIILLVTGEATATNDVVGEIFRLEFMPHE